MQRRIFLLPAVILSVLVFSAAAQAQQKFTVSLIGAQEVPPVNSSGRGTCMVTLNLTETQITATCTYANLTSNTTAAHIHNNGPVGVNGPVLFPLTGTLGATSGTLSLPATSVTPAQVAELRAKRMYVNIHTANFPGGEIRGQIKIHSTPFDFEGDGRTDVRVYRTSDSAFYTLLSVNNSITRNFFGGISALTSASDDYDGDGRGDLVLLHASNGGLYWRILQTATNTVREVQWGASATDRAMPADYDGDGKTDIAVHRVGTGFWYILQSSDNKSYVEQFGLAQNGMVGDFDKDGKSDLTILGSVTGNSQIGWYTRRSSDAKVQVVLWGGGAGDFIFPSAQIDVDGDGKQDHMIMRDPNNTNPQTGDPVTFYVLRSSDNQPFVLPWGLDTDGRLFGDYDGDGKTDFVARRTINGQYVWYIYQSSNGQGRAVTFGATGDQ